MAWYCAESVRYRGRVVLVMFRYDSFMDANVESGKPLKLTPRDMRKIKRILRRQKKAFGIRCDHGCGGPHEDDYLPYGTGA